MQTTAATNESCIERHEHLSLPDAVMAQMLLLEANSTCADNSNKTSVTPALKCHGYVYLIIGSMAPSDLFYDIDIQDFAHVQCLHKI